LHFNHSAQNLRINKSGSIYAFYSRFNEGKCRRFVIVGNSYFYTGNKENNAEISGF